MKITFTENEICKDCFFVDDYFIIISLIFTFEKK